MKPKLSKYSQTAEQIRFMTESSLRVMRAKGMTYEKIGEKCGVGGGVISRRCQEYDIQKGSFNKKKL